MPAKIYFWKLRKAELHLGVRTLIMGVLNVTPDSFSDGGRYSDPDLAYARALELEEAGADIIDIGAESTKPGSQRISAEEEWRRLVPVLKRLKDQLRVPISLDTYKGETAERAFEYGVEIINDPSGLTFDPNLAKVVAQASAGFVLNHMRGAPETWGKLGPLQDLMGSIGRDLEATAHRAQRAGVERSRIVVDPGLGFGKRKEQNSEILARLGELTGLEYPILVGPSRKSFIARGTEEETAFATAAAVTAAILGGAHIVRVHDVAAMHPAVRVADEIVRARDAALREHEETIKVKRVMPAWTGDGPKPVKPVLKVTTPPVPVAASGDAAVAAAGSEGVVPETAVAAAGQPDVRPVAPRREERREEKRYDSPRRDGPPPRFAAGGFRGREDRPSDGPNREYRRFDGPPGRGDDRPRRDGPPGGFRRDGPPNGDRRDGPPGGPRRFDGPPRRFDGPPSGPRRFDGPPRRFDGPPSGPPRRFDGPPRRFDGPPGGPRRDGPPGGPRRFDGPPRRFDGPPGGPRRDGPPGGPRRFDGPPRRFDGPPSGPRRDGPPGGFRKFDGPPRGPRPGGFDKGGRPPFRRG